MATTTSLEPRRPVGPTLQDRPPRAHASRLGAILPAVLLFYSALMPSEVRVALADQVLYPPRIASLLILMPILWRLLRGEVRLGIWDLLVCFSAFWMVLSFIIVYGPEGGLLRGGALAFDVIVPYLAGRVCFRDADDLRRFLVVVAPGLAIAGLSMLVEVLLSRPVIRPAVAAIFGALPVYENGVEVGVRGSVVEARLGILRASGPFSHPILAGLFLASFLPLYLASGIRSWPKSLGLVASALGFFSVSSAAVLALMMGAGFYLLDLAQRSIQFLSWRLMIATIGVTILILELASKNGVIAIMGRYTFSNQTTLYRRLIWEFGTQSVANNPWFGIGFKSYERPVWMVKSSVDNNWLLMAIRFGVLPALALFVVFVAGTVLLAVAANKRSEIDRRMYVGLAISVFTVGILAFTVAMFSGTQAWFFMLMAIAISLGTAQPWQGRNASQFVGPRFYRPAGGMRTPRGQVVQNFKR
jgi:O-antigen ligase